MKEQSQLKSDHVKIQNAKQSGATVDHGRRLVYTRFK